MLVKLILTIDGEQQEEPTHRLSFAQRDKKEEQTVFLTPLRSKERTPISHTGVVVGNNTNYRKKLPGPQQSDKMPKQLCSWIKNIILLQNVVSGKISYQKHKLETKCHIVCQTIVLWKRMSMSNAHEMLHDPASARQLGVEKTYRRASTNFSRQCLRWNTGLLKSICDVTHIRKDITLKY